MRSELASSKAALSRQLDDLDFHRMLSGEYDRRTHCSTSTLAPGGPRARIGHRCC